MKKNTCEVQSLLEPTRCSARPGSELPSKRDAESPANPLVAKRSVQRLALDSWENEGGCVSHIEPKECARQGDPKKH